MSHMRFTIKDLNPIESITCRSGPACVVPFSSRPSRITDFARSKFTLTVFGGFGKTSPVSERRWVWVGTTRERRRRDAARGPRGRPIPGPQGPGYHSFAARAAGRAVLSRVRRAFPRWDATSRRVGGEDDPRRDDSRLLSAAPNGSRLPGRRCGRQARHAGAAAPRRGSRATGPSHSRPSRAGLPFLCRSRGRPGRPIPRPAGLPEVGRDFEARRR